MANTLVFSPTNNTGRGIYPSTKYFGAVTIGDIGIGSQFKGEYDSAVDGGFVQYRVQETNIVGKSYTIIFVSNPNYQGFNIYKIKSEDDADFTTCLSYEIVDSASVSTATITDSSAFTDQGESGSVADELEASSGYQVDLDTILRIDDVWSEESNGKEFYSVANLLGVFGLPYQFMPHVDPRLRYQVNGVNVAGTSAYITDTQGTGSEYADHIASKMPVLFLSPGIPNFMTKFSKNDKQTILDYIAQTAGGIAGNLTTDDLLKDSGKYYTFEYDIPEYYKHVNPMCRIASLYMEVEDYTWDGVKMQSVNWMDYTMSKLDGIFQGKTEITDYMSIPFYLESETQISESFSNDTTESSILSSIDSISDIGREAMFILGYSQSALLNKSIVDVSGDSAEITQQVLDKLGPVASNNSFIGKLITNLTSVATGGRLVFPKIWSDSSFSRSYDVTIKLRSPDMDNLSIYLNIIVPFLHLLGFVLPRQLSGNPNGYASPFLVRAIYKGFFNIDMGLVTNMSVTKGDQAQFNAEGIPTAIDVNLTIADLYENMSMTPTTATNWAYDTMDNTCQMDYIATMCGINIYQPEVGRLLKMWMVNNVINRARDIISINVWGNIQNSIANAIVGMWRGRSM